MNCYRDPLIWAGTLLSTLIIAYALFIGEYLPYIDWSNHLAIISVLAHGQESGALDFMSRSWTPTPYFLFYGLSALLAQFVNVVTAAKLSLVLAAVGFSLGACAWAESMGRDPRQGLIGPLAFFGISLGYGFASFVFATPFLFFALAAAEPIFQKQDKKRDLIILSVCLCLAYLAHALIFLVIALLLILRTIIDLGLTRKTQSLRALTFAALPSVLLALPATITQVSTPWQEAGSADLAPKQWMYFVSWPEHRIQFWGHLLERGSVDHIIIMKLAAALFILWLIFGLIQNRKDKAPRNLSAWVYASSLALLFFLGPNSIEWPSSLWMIYPRFGVIAAVAIFLIPRPQLKKPLGITLALCATALVISNSQLNAKHIQRFSAWAQNYDEVRKLIPKKSRVLALTVVKPPDFATYHPALGSLYFYHMVDGASYVAFMFDAAAMPVRQKQDVKPNAPFWKTPFAFDPKTHGQAFDYLVLRGQGLIQKTDAGELHEKVKTVHGWSVYKTKKPDTRP